MKKNVSKYYILLVLALMFAAPGITAYLFYLNPTWLGSSTVNKGTLLNPPVVLKSLDAQAKWRIVFWNPGPCDEACMTQLDTLARVRLALGRKLYYVDQWLILDDQAVPLSQTKRAIIQGKDFHVASVNALENPVLPSKAAVFLANPDNYLILSYESQVNPDDVYKDLKLLLNTTQTKSD